MSLSQSKEKSDGCLTLNGGFINDEKWTLEIYVEVELTGFSDRLNIVGEGEGEIEDDSSMTNDPFLEVLHLSNLLFS